jgi:hypothetical protein
MISRKEAKEIVDWVLQEVYKKRFPYITDGKIDLTKTVVGPISGTQSYGGAIADGAIWDRQVNSAAAVQAYKIAVSDPSGYFSGDNVQDVLYELFLAIGAVTFIGLTDTPSQYTAAWSHKGWIPVINQAENGLEFKPLTYYDGGGFSEACAGAVEVNGPVADGGSFTDNIILDGGN